MPSTADNDTPPVCDYEGSDYQAVFWDTGERAYEDRSERVALKHLLPSTGHRFLEIGAGAGRQTPLLSQFDQVVLLDYSRTQLQQAQARLGKDNPRYTYVAANVYQLPFVAGAFDGAMMVRVLHHLAEAPRALTEICRVMQTGGTFVLEFANKRNLKSMLRYALGRQSWSPYDLAPVEFVALNFDFHPRAVRQWLGEAGFTVQRQRAVSHFRLGLLKRSLPTGLLVAADALLQPTGNWLQFSPSVFVQAKVTAQHAPSLAEGLFCCPTCGSAELTDHSDHLACTCGLKWAVRDGIYDFKDPLNAEETQ